MNEPCVHAIILNWNNYRDTIECIESLLHSTYRNLRVTIVDNASDNDSEAILRQKFPELAFIQTGKNLGFSGGNNVAIKSVLKQGADYVLLLNNDTVVKPDFLEHLVDVGEHEPKVGILGGKTFNYHDKRRICSAGADINWLKGTAAFHRGEGQIDAGKYEERCNVTFVPGYFMLVKAEVFKAAGYLDERYFLGVEEIDFCVQARKHGFELTYIPEAVIWHKVTASHQKYAPMFVYNGYRNKLMFMKRYLSRTRWVVWFMFFKSYSVFVAPFRLQMVSRRVGERLSFFEFRRACKMAFRDRHKPKVTLEDLLKFKES